MKASVAASFAGVLLLGLHVNSEKVHANALDFVKHGSMVEAHYNDEDFFTEKNHQILFEEDASFIDVAKKENERSRISNSDTTIDQNGSFRDQKLKVLRNIDVPGTWHEPLYIEDTPKVAFRKGTSFGQARFRAISEAGPKKGKDGPPGLPNADTAIAARPDTNTNTLVTSGILQETYPSTVQPVMPTNILQPTIPYTYNAINPAMSTGSHSNIVSVGPGIARENAQFTTDPAMPYWSVGHEPMFPSLQSPIFTSTPVEFYSDGRRYPEDMEEYDHFPSKLPAGEAGKAGKF